MFVIVNDDPIIITFQELDVGDFYIYTNIPDELYLKVNAGKAVRVTTKDGCSYDAKTLIVTADLAEQVTKMFLASPVSLRKET